MGFLRKATLSPSETEGYEGNATAWCRSWPHYERQVRQNWSEARHDSHQEGSSFSGHDRHHAVASPSYRGALELYDHALERDLRDLGGMEEAHRWAPEACAAAHVEERA